MIEFDLQTASLEYISTYLDVPATAAGRTVGKRHTTCVTSVDTDLSDTHQCSRRYPLMALSND